MNLEGRSAERFIIFMCFVNVVKLAERVVKLVSRINEQFNKE